MYLETTLPSTIRICKVISFYILFLLSGDQDGFTMHPDGAASSGGIEPTGSGTVDSAGPERWSGRRGSWRANEEAGQV